MQNRLHHFSALSPVMAPHCLLVESKMLHMTYKAFHNLAVPTLLVLLRQGPWT